MSVGGRGVFVYLLISFGLAWTLWGIALALGTARGPFFQIAILPGALAPAIAAFVVRAFVTDEGFADAGLRPNLRRGWRPYLAGWLLPLVVVATILLLSLALGIGDPDLSLREYLQGLAPGADLPPSALLWLVLPVQLTVNALIFTPVLLGEEFGWRGYLQPRLFAERPSVAAVATGLIWAVWHYPLILFAGYSYPNDRLLGAFLIYPVLTVMLSVIFGWLRLATGSVWAPSLAHAAANTVGGSLSLLLFPEGPATLVGYTGALAWVPLGAVCAWILLTGRLASNMPTSGRVA